MFGAVPVMPMSGQPCYRCGRPTWVSELADALGKSDRMQPVCYEHARSKIDAQSLADAEAARAKQQAHDTALTAELAEREAMLAAVDA